MNFFHQKPEAAFSDSSLAHKDFIHALESGNERAAFFDGTHWIVNEEVKKKILNIFSQSPTIAMGQNFRDKEALSPQNLASRSDLRIVPQGSTVRSGAFLGSGVVVMPPSYINVGAYIDNDCMIDHHVLIGSCAQIGKRVHVSAGSLICGVLEPIGNRPVVIEDDCFIGAGCILAEGIWIRKGSVLGMGVQISASSPIYDKVHDCYHTYVPENAVVIQASKRLSVDKIEPYQDHTSFSLPCAMIVKYRNEKTNIKVALEEALRNF